MGKLRDTAWLVRNAGRNIHETLVGRDLAMLRKLQREGRVTYGPGTYGTPPIYTWMNATESLHVANYTSVGSLIMLGGKHPTDRVTTYPHRIWMDLPGAGEDGFPEPTGDTIVGSDVWLCYESILVSGVTVGDGAIVAAGAVVTKAVPPYAIVGGNPARVIRYRFSDEQIADLLDIRWWDWPEADIREAVPLLAGKDVDEFIEYARARGPRPSGQPALRQ